MEAAPVIGVELQSIQRLPGQRNFRAEEIIVTGARIDREVGSHIVANTVITQPADCAQSGCQLDFGLAV